MTSKNTFQTSDSFSKLQAKALMLNWHAHEFGHAFANVVGTLNYTFTHVEAAQLIDFDRASITSLVEHEFDEPMGPIQREHEDRATEAAFLAMKVAPPLKRAEWVGGTEYQTIEAYLRERAVLMRKTAKFLAEQPEPFWLPYVLNINLKAARLENLVEDQLPMFHMRPRPPMLNPEDP